MKIPKKVRIGHVTYKIVPMSKSESYSADSYGCYMGNECTIVVDATRDPQLVKDTLLHEIMHGVWYWGGLEDGDKQERIVTLMATGLTQVLKDNPKIGEFLTG